MIIKGKSRSGPSALAAHLGNAETNESVSLVETRGTISDDLRGALIEMDAYAAGTRCEKPLYHAAISPEPPHLLSPEERSQAIDALEVKLGFDGHARVVVIHEKKDRQHIHVVWSRIDLEKNRSVSDSHNYRKHEECARELERLFGHDRVQGAHTERDGVDRPDRTPSRSELRQEERTGITGKRVKEEVSRAFRASDGAEAFKAALEDLNYALARGDRRDFVVVDQAGGIHSLARRIDGIKAAELREFMQPIDRERLPSANEAREGQIAKAKERGLTLDNQPNINAAESDSKRRREELKKSHADAKLEKSYGRSDDYVSQSQAALRDHTQRQAELDRASNAKKLFIKGGVEISEEKQAKIDALQQRIEREQLAPDRQGEVPSGGRSRDR